MRKLAFSILTLMVLLGSCSKKNDVTPQEQNTFQATVNNQDYTFKVLAATLLRSAQTGEKRLDISGVSEDGTKRLIITLGEQTDQGNGVAVKSFVLNPFPDDDPDTEDEDESLLTEGFTTYSTSLGNNSWYTGIYNESVVFIVTACDASNTSISGSFETTLVNMNDDTDITTITKGKITNIKYSVLN